MLKRLQKKLLGVKTDFNGGKQKAAQQNMELFITHDWRGISLSVASKQDNIMYTIPLDNISDEVIETLSKAKN